MGALPKVLIHLLNESELAEMLGVSLATVRRWRLIRQGPKYIKLGASVRYNPEDVASWLESRPSGGCVHSQLHAAESMGAR